MLEGLSRATSGGGGGAAPTTYTSQLSVGLDAEKLGIRTFLNRGVLWGCREIATDFWMLCLIASFGSEREHMSWISAPNFIED